MALKELPPLECMVHQVTDYEYSTLDGFAQTFYDNFNECCTEEFRDMIEDTVTDNLFEECFFNVFVSRRTEHLEL